MGAVGTAFGTLAKGVQVKLIAALVGILILTNAINFFVTKTVYYNKGLNQAEVLIKKYEGDVARLQAEVNKKGSAITERVVTKVVTKTQYITRVVTKNGETIVQYVPTSVPQLPKGWIYAHNQAAAGLPIDPALAADKTLTQVSDVDALGRVSSNYGICKINQVKLDGWQNWYGEMKKLYEETKAKDVRKND